jgi:hypothetical protein
MINFDFLQFDQTNLWFFVLSALGLVRERRILPFLIVILGNLVHGSLPASLLASLILWHRMDLPAPKWVQLKDALGFFLIFVSMVAPEPVQEFCVCFGVLILSMSFGRGGLGVIPAVLLLRQFVTHPQDLEILMGVAGLYWVSAEGLRLAKISQEKLIRSILEGICSLGILYGLKDVFLKWIEEPALIWLGSGILVIVLVVGSLAHWRQERFWVFYRKTKRSLSGSLTYGNRFISSDAPWSEEPRNDDFSEIQGSFDRLFFLTLLTIGLLVLFYLVNRGGLA